MKKHQKQCNSTQQHGSEFCTQLEVRGALGQQLSGKVAAAVAAQEGDAGAVLACSQHSQRQQHAEQSGDHYAVARLPPASPNGVVPGLGAECHHRTTLTHAEMQWAEFRAYILALIQPCGA